MNPDTEVNPSDYPPLKKIPLIVTICFHKTSIWILLLPLDKHQIKLMDIKKITKNHKNQSKGIYG